MGRITNPSIRARIQDIMKQMWHQYSRGFKDTEMQLALDDILHKISNETAAMIYWGHFSAADMVVATGMVDNRRIINQIKEGYRGIETCLPKQCSVDFTRKLFFNISNVKIKLKMTKHRTPNFSKENFEKARIMFREGSSNSARSSRLLKMKDYSGSIEASQHAVELFIKSLFLLAGFEPPKTHDPGKNLDLILEEFLKLNPSVFSNAPVDPIARLKLFSNKFSRLHVEAMYGFNNAPASKIFTESDAIYYYECAFEIEFICLLIAFTFGYHFELLPEEGRRFLEEHVSSIFDKRKK